MRTFDEVMQRLRMYEGVRQTPVDAETFHKNLLESNDISEIYGGSLPTARYPIPNNYNQSVESPKTIDFTDSIDPAIRNKVIALRKHKNKDESVVYSDDKKEALVIKKDEVPDYISKGYMVIYEEANVTMSPTGGQFVNTNGAFDVVGGADRRLKKRKKKVFRR